MEDKTLVSLIFRHYLQRNSFRNELINSVPSDDLGCVVVIPAYNEKSLIPCLSAIDKCTAPESEVEVIIVINASEKDPEVVKQTNLNAKVEAQKWWNEQRGSFKLHFIMENELPAKHAGVGLARKIGMDEAVRRFDKTHNEQGVIICFDADSSCDYNYLQEIELHFKNTKAGACSIYFEHPTKGKSFEEEIYKGIYWYELHLRYYKNGLKYANLPFAFHTIGSSMAVRAIDYCKQGGMNRRKAGEDFYFLQKFIDVGQLNELNTTKVIPSPRSSDRVPFGTGRAIQEMLEAKREIGKSYSFQSFETLKECFRKVASWYSSVPDFHATLIAFLGEEVLQKKIKEIRTQSSSKERFEKRFFQWFNAFQTLKFIHFLRDKYYPNEELRDSVSQLIRALKIENTENDNLETLRKFDRKIS